MFDARRLDQFTLLAIVMLTAVAASASPALAQDALSIAVTGTLPHTCNASVPGDQTIDPGSSQPQPIGTAGFECNFVGSPTIRFWSEGAGLLKAPAAPSNGNVAQVLPYQFTYDGTQLGQLTDSSETAMPITRTAAAGASKLGEASIQILTAAIVAGTYSDTIYLGITP